MLISKNVTTLISKKFVYIIICLLLTSCCWDDNNCRDCINDNCNDEILTEAKIDSPAIQMQQTPVWCWAASIQNALASYGVSVGQDKIVITTYGDTVNLPIFDPRQAVINLLNENYLVAPYGKVIHPYFVNGPPSPNVLVRELSREKSPILVLYKNPQGGGHVVVCYGVKYTGNEASPTITEVMVKDPWDATEKCTEIVIA